MKIIDRGQGPGVYPVRIRYAVAGTVEPRTRAVCFPIRSAGLRDSPAALGKRHRDSRCRSCRLGVGGAGGSVCFDAGADFRRSSSRRSTRGICRTANRPSLVDAAALFEAARAQSDQSLGSLATKVKTIHSWDDLVLPRVDAATSERNYRGDSTSACGVFRVGIRKTHRRRPGSQNSLFRGFGNRQNDDRGSDRRGSGPGSLQNRSLRHRQQIHRRDREKSRSHFSRRAVRATRSCSSMKPMRSSANAPK